jgi:hypothetical protein
MKYRGRRESGKGSSAAFSFGTTPSHRKASGRKKASHRHLPLAGFSLRGFSAT